MCISDWHASLHQFSLYVIKCVLYLCFPWKFSYVSPYVVIFVFIICAPLVICTSVGIRGFCVMLSPFLGVFSDWSDFFTVGSWMGYHSVTFHVIHPSNFLPPFGNSTLFDVYPLGSCLMCISDWHASLHQFSLYVIKCVLYLCFPWKFSYVSPYVVIFVFIICAPLVICTSVGIRGFCVMLSPFLGVFSDWSDFFTVGSWMGYHSVTFHVIHPSNFLPPFGNSTLFDVYPLGSWALIQ